MAAEMSPYAVVQNHDAVINEICQQINNEDLDINQRLECVSRSILAGREAVQFLGQAAVEFQEKINKLNFKVFEIELERDKFKAQLDSTNTELVALRNESLRRTAMEMAAVKIETLNAVITHKRILQTTAMVGAVVSSPLVAPVFPLIKVMGNLGNTIDKLNDRKWVYDTFPESSVCDNIFAVALKARKKYSRKMRSAETTMSHASDSRDSAFRNRLYGEAEFMQSEARDNLMAAKEKVAEMVLNEYYIS